MNPLSQHEVEQALWANRESLSNHITEHSKRLLAFHDADRAYDIARSRARLTLKTEAGDAGEKLTVSDIDALALLHTVDERTARDIAEARLEASKEAGRNLRAIGDDLRSLNANLREVVA